MIEIKLAIFIGIALSLFCLLLGCVIMGLASVDSYQKGYEDGYDMGKKTEKERIINKIDKHMRG